MASPVHVPRINNNDDQVKLIGLEVTVGQKVTRGGVLGQIETAKAVVDIESPSDGFVLGFLAEVDATIDVGSVLLWLGETADEPMPKAAKNQETTTTGDSNTPTAKARILLQRHGLTANQVPRSGERLSAQDVEAYLASKGSTAPGASKTAAPRADRRPDVPGTSRKLRPDERGMVATVSWSREFAVPGYVELEYDPEPWASYAKDYADRHRLMLSPLLSLMSWRLVEIARETPALNATLIGDERYEYDQVNFGFTVQAGETLYLTVLRDAGSLNETSFIQAQGDIQRRAAGHKLVPDELQGATVSFSSMARWKISRHIPILPPHTAIMVAHAMSADGRHVLGATYDHRVLNGFQVVNALRKLSKPTGSTDSKKETT